jgi:hypothetical protein
VAADCELVMLVSFRCYGDSSHVAYNEDETFTWQCNCGGFNTNAEVLSSNPTIIWCTVCARKHEAYDNDGVDIEEITLETVRRATESEGTYSYKCRCSSCMTIHMIETENECNELECECEACGKAWIVDDTYS